MRFLRIKPLQILVLVLACTPAGVRADSISRKDFQHPQGGMPGEERYEKTVLFGGAVAVPVRIDVTAKGNGFMTVLNLRLKVFDAHDDGAVYDGGLLHIDFVDLGDTGFKDMVISGLVIYTGEKKDSPHTTEPVVFVYRFVPKLRTLKLVYKRASFDLSDGP